MAWVWWNAGQGEVHELLAHCAAMLRDRQKARHREDWRHARLYAGMRPDLVTAFGAMGYVAAASSGPSRLPRFSFNVIESVVETLLSRLASNEVRPVYVTDGEQWDGQERAELLTQFVDGCFYASRFRDDVAIEAATDCLVFGTGVSFTFRDRLQIKSERVFPLEILVDEEDGMHRDPRMLIRHKPVAREVLIAQVAARTDITEKDRDAMIRAIRKAPVSKTDMLQSSMSDNVMVYEGYHLPSGIDAKDGRHVKCIEGADLWDEEWTRPNFPYEFLRWKHGLLGFWGRGIAEQLTGIQIEINRVISHVQQSLSGAAFKIFVEQASGILDSHIDRSIGAIIRYRGTAPQFYSPNVVSDQVLNWLISLYQKAYELTGVSQMAAQGNKPQGVTAGVAIRAVDDLQDGRIARFGRRYETWHIANAEQQIDLARELYGQKEDLSVATPGSEFLRRIKWSDIDLERDQYIAQVFAESALPKTPAARKQAVQEYMQANLITPDEGRRLLRMPDLRSAQDLDDGPRNLVLEQIGQMLKGEPASPDPAQDFALAKKMVNQAICNAVVKKVPSERVQLMRDFVETLDATMQNALADQAASAPPAPAPGGPAGPAAPPGAQMGKPAAPPTSDLMPFKGGPQAA